MTPAPVTPLRSKWLASLRALLVAALFAAAILSENACGTGASSDSSGDATDAGGDELNPAWPSSEIAGLQHLGATPIPGGVNFGVYSARATRVELLLFNNPDSATPTKRYLMKQLGEVWNLAVASVPAGEAYGFIAWGPNWPYSSGWKPGTTAGFISDVDSAGNRFNPNKLLIDPYARGFARRADWSKATPASGPGRAVSTWAASGKSIVVASKYAWSANETAWRAARKTTSHAGHGWNDLVIYETHPKGFTANPSSGVAHPGTFRGLGEKADYFKDLGITAVELLPAFQKSNDGGYWGYQTIGFFAPELTYAVSATGALDEFKWMVDQLHQRGLEVLLDVVYNHTGEGGLYSEVPSGVRPQDTANVFAFRGLDNASYYALSGDQQTYWNNTGVGNETRPNNRPMRQLILDSLHYWVTEAHVDGFRFDLAPILGERDQDYNSFDSAHTVLQTIADDAVLQANNTRVVAEPWSLYGAYIGGFPAASADPGVGWYEWNGRFRDWWRAFADNDAWTLRSQEGGGDAGFLLTGSYDWFHWNGRRPYHSVNFVAIHDGFTLYDVFSYDQKSNGCSAINPICCTQPGSLACEPNGGESNNRSRSWGNEDVKRQLVRGMFAAMLLANGTPMLLGGDEWLRTQFGNNNAYNDGADSLAGWYDWGNWAKAKERQRMHDFVRALVAFRKAHGYALSPSDYGGGAHLRWQGEKGTDGADWSSKHVALYFDDQARGHRLDILVNYEGGPVTFTLPAGVSWKRVIDTQAWYDGAGWFDGTAGRDDTKSANATLSAPVAVSGAYTVPARNIVVLEEL